MSHIKILIVEDDKDWRRGLAAFLSAEPDLQIVAQAENREEAMQAIESVNIDVVLMDILLANSVEGIEITAEMSRKYGAKIIMLTSLEEKEMMFSAFRAGALDYMIKSDFEKIPDSIRSAYENQSPINPQAAQQIREEFKRLKKLEQEFKVKEMRALITPTELEILKLIYQGKTQTQISDTLVVSIRTVKNHVSNILKKLELTSSKEAAEQAKDMGLF
ncbi:response regulator transcription factor [Chengkuizengella axinellae]|uniref:Response regulator transcription factor n=1 Tax=Chengkuizengella axinellae TaxID=3064388 RepID=A0ABT9ITZ7_9BACL|nr:response regulator transcription factor [Chengkuizengella sp. 2205SS18-9]MDP5272821.1 response regulator transcription factor [Chengkuizengella sp. 2205SS18-9]